MPEKVKRVEVDLSASVTLRRRDGTTKTYHPQDGKAEMEEEDARSLGKLPAEIVEATGGGDAPPLNATSGNRTTRSRASSAAAGGTARKTTGRAASKTAGRKRPGQSAKDRAAATEGRAVDLPPVPDTATSAEAGEVLREAGEASDATRSPDAAAEAARTTS